MTVKRHIHRTVLLMVSAAFVATGCGSSSHAAAPTTSPTVTTLPTTTSTALSTTKKAGALSTAEVAAILTCLKAHGVAVPASGAAQGTAKQVRVAFTGLPATQQQDVVTACGPLLPASLRQELQSRIGQETSTTTVAP